MLLQPIAGSLTQRIDAHRQIGQYTAAQGRHLVCHLDVKKKSTSYQAHSQVTCHL